MDSTNQKSSNMDRLPFRHYHLFQLLDAYESGSLPLDLFISRYFRAHPAIGSKDRGEIAENVYALVRWKALLDYLCAGEPTWKNRFELFRSKKPETFLTDESIPLPIRVSFPKELFNLIINSYGLEKGSQICLASNYPAPTAVRINPLKINREKLFDNWKEKYEISLSNISPDGMIFHKKINFFSLPEFKKGYFEVQDEGSQLLAFLVEAKPGEQVLDYCAGSGGKTLAFAPGMKQKGQIYLHDIRKYILQESRTRLRRAGIQNAQILLPDSPSLPKLKKKMDWVLVDAPCSGTGTLRRNPDMKWKFSSEMLKRLCGEQRKIFEKALSFLKPGGKIVYSTCSILKEENEEQAAHFLKTYPISLSKTYFQSLPKEGGMDGFFGAVFRTCSKSSI